MRGVRQVGDRLCVLKELGGLARLENIAAQKEKLVSASKGKLETG